MKQRVYLIILAGLVIFLYTKIVNPFHIFGYPHHDIVISCAVIPPHGIGQICVRSDPGASVQVSVSYCQHHDIVKSPAITQQTPGTQEYRWTWRIGNGAPPGCTQAEVAAAAAWSDGGQAQAETAIQLE